MMRTIKRKMLEVDESTPNRILLVLDSLNWTAWEKASPHNIPMMLGSEARKVHSPGCCTLPTLVSYLSNYPPIGVGLGLQGAGAIQ